MRKALFVLLVVSCSSHNRGTQNGPDFGLTFADGGGDQDLAGIESEDLLMSFVAPDLSGLEAGSFHIDLSVDRDASGCSAGQMGASCATPIDPNAGCQPVEDCVANGGNGNGLDDDCNGKVDDGCPCNPGDVHRCFLGPPGKHNVGACTDGTQTCIGSIEFPSWGDCDGSIGPTTETCDGLDNDCNGCADDQLCCSGGVVCPGPNDPKIAPIAPFNTKMYHGPDFFSGTVTSWSWTVEGGPCDKLFASPDFTPQPAAGSPAQQSFTVTGANSPDLSIFFSLSGDYTVTLTIVDDMGRTYTCKWVQHVEGPGVRFELCWDHQGTLTQGGADLDLHVHRSGTTSKWFATNVTDTGHRCTGKTKDTCAPGAFCSGGECFRGVINPDDCHYVDCTAGEYTATTPPNLYPGAPQPDWQYPNSPVGNCSGNAKYGAVWTSLGYCHNPRLDLDNILTAAFPENTNIDNPGNGDTFRAMVHYYGRGQYIPCAYCSLLGPGFVCDPAGKQYCVYSNATTQFVEGSAASTATYAVHPIVNIYCGGQLKATYGQAPNQLQGFDWGVAGIGGEMWRVADVTAAVDSSGNTTDCTVAPRHGATSIYDVTAKTNNNIDY